MRRSTGLWAYAGSAASPTAVYTRPSSFRAVDMLVIVLDGAGRPLGELQTHGAVESVVWRVDGHATAPMTLAPSIMDDKPGLLAVGNRVLIRFSNGLPDWGGVIDPPIEYSSRAIRTTFYSAEYMFGWPLTPRYADYTGARARTPRGIMVDLMTYVETPARYGIRPPGVWSGADLGEPTVETTYSFETLTSAFGKLRELDSRLHWYVRPLAGPTGVTFETIAYRDALTDATGAVLLQGMNFTDVELIEQGPIFNAVTVAGQGAAFDDPDVWPMVVTAIDESSIKRYGGRREKFQVLPDIKTENATEGNFTRRANETLRVTKAPRLRFRGRALDMPPAGFREWRLGRRVTAELHWPGVGMVSIPVTIIGMEYEAAGASLNLVVQYDDEATV
jgi:hypothetical protein